MWLWILSRFNYLFVLKLISQLFAFPLNAVSLSWCFYYLSLSLSVTLSSYAWCISSLIRQIRVHIMCAYISRCEFVLVLIFNHTHTHTCAWTWTFWIVPGFFFFSYYQLLLAFKRLASYTFKHCAHTHTAYILVCISQFLCVCVWLLTRYHISACLKQRAFTCLSIFSYLELLSKLIVTFLSLSLEMILFFLLMTVCWLLSDQSLPSFQAPTYMSIEFQDHQLSLALLYIQLLNFSPSCLQCVCVAERYIEAFFFFFFLDFNVIFFFFFLSVCL